MPVDLTPSEEKILKYMREHRTPVTADKMCKYFLMSRSNASRSLINLAHFGFAEIITAGKTKLYKVKE